MTPGPACWRQQQEGDTMCDTDHAGERVPPDRPVVTTNTIQAPRTIQEGRRKKRWSLLVERSISAAQALEAPPAAVGTQSGRASRHLVQYAVLRALPHLKTFEAKHPGALKAHSALGREQPHSRRDQESEIMPARHRALGRPAGRGAVAARAGDWTAVAGAHQAALKSVAPGRTVRRSSPAWNCSKAAPRNRDCPG